MNALSVLGEIRKRQTETLTRDADLMKVAGWSRKVFRDRMNNPHKITLGELVDICNYLQIHNL